MLMTNSSESTKQVHTLGLTAVLHSCPHFGIADDVDTPLLFAVEGAVCHRSQPLGEVELSYQQTSCLTAEHRNCPVFLHQQRGPLPPEISGFEVGYHRSRRLFLGVMVILLFAVVGILAGLWWTSESEQLAASIPPNGGEEVGFDEAAVVEPTQTAVPTPTPTAVPPATVIKIVQPDPTAVPTRTPQPTDTPTPLLPPTFTPLPSPEVPTETAVPPIQAVVNVERLNVRLGPGVDYPSLGLVDLGANLTVSGRISNATWLQVCCVEGVAGWVYTESVITEGDLAQLPVILDIPLLPDAEP
jgi:hypothetical protein